MEAAVDVKLAAGQFGGEIELAPNISCTTRENDLGLSLVSVQILGHAEDAKQVGAGAAVLAIFLGLAHGAADQILGDDGLLFVRFVLRWTGLEVKTQGATVFVIKLIFRQLTEIIAGNH